MVVVCAAAPAAVDEALAQGAPSAVRPPLIPGELDSWVAIGPKGMSVMLAPCDGMTAFDDWAGPPTGDADSPAELIVGCPTDAGDTAAPQALARAHHSYVAVANAAGFDGVRCHFGRSAVVGFDGHTLGECGEEDMGIQYAQLSKTLIRDARKTGQSQNHLYKLVHRGYTGMINSGESAQGVAACPYDFYAKWVNDPEGTQEMVEKITRPMVGTEECPIDGIPNPSTLGHK